MNHRSNHTRWDADQGISVNIKLTVDITFIVYNDYKHSWQQQNKKVKNKTKGKQYEQQKEMSNKIW